MSFRLGISLSVYVHVTACKNLCFPQLFSIKLNYPIFSHFSSSPPFSLPLQGKLSNGPSTDAATDPAAMAAVRFCLSLFSASLKRNKLDPSDPLVLSMSAPFVPLLGQCLRLTGAVDVVTLATRCLCTLLTWRVQVENSFVQAVGKWTELG